MNAAHICTYQSAKLKIEFSDEKNPRVRETYFLEKNLFYNYKDQSKFSIEEPSLKSDQQRYANELHKKRYP